jgi:4-amino-4-deoxy-L-arabinose transferase-like glycosyltransferase
MELRSHLRGDLETEQVTTAAVLARGSALARSSPGLVLALLVGFALSCWIFANVQDVWIDESTQLSGITLAFPDMLKWLAGENSNRFGVPGDRMPPVSYVIDWLWLRIGGPGELGFRLVHASIATAGLWVIARVTQARFGTWGAVACLLLLATSPNMLQLATEVRAYPIFFALTCLQLWLFLKLLEVRGSPELKLLAGFVVVSLLAVFTHFFGLVSTCAFLFALGLANIRDWQALAKILAAGGVIMAFAMGALPFVFAAAGISTASEVSGANAGDYATYLLRLILNPIHLLWPWAGAAYFLALALLLGTSAYAAMRRAMRRSVQPADWLWVVLGAGIAAVLAASVVAKGFNALKPSYSVWLIPVIAVLAASGMAELVRLRAWNGRGPFLVVGVLAVGGGFAIFQMLAHASLFVHGPRRAILNEVQGARGAAAVVYESGPDWSYAQIPIQFTTGGGLRQFVVRGAAGVDQPVIGKPATQLQSLEDALSQFSTVFLVHVKSRRHGELRACLDGACPSMPPFDATERLIASGTWQEARRHRQFGTYDVEIRTLVRVASARGS